MKETGGRWGDGGRSVIKMRAEEKAHVRNKKKCGLWPAWGHMRVSCALAKGIRGDPCTTGELQ